MTSNILNSTVKLLIQIIHGRSPTNLDLLTAGNDQEFLIALDFLVKKAVDTLEINKKNFEKLGETGLTAHIIGALSMTGLTVSAEQYSNGHADITIVFKNNSHERKIIGEAKIYDGPNYHIDGVEQLLSYMTGRELRGILIFYHRKQGIDDSVRKLRKRMDADSPCQQQGETRDHTYKWWFLSTHTHSSGENLELTHIGCNLFQG